MRPSWNWTFEVDAVSLDDIITDVPALLRHRAKVPARGRRTMGDCNPVRCLKAPSNGGAFFIAPAHEKSLEDFTSRLWLLDQ